jgi:putative membrane protein
MELLLPKNDRKARILILTFSVIIFIAVTALERVTLDVDLGFDPHVFALTNAAINSVVAGLLVAGLVAAKNRKYTTHRNIMLAAMVLSVIFLVSYVLHHLFAGSTLYGDLDRNGIVTDLEKAEAGAMRYVYFFFLGTHILLAGISLPYILFTAYRALINENARHRKIARITWPMWFYVALTGPIVYLMISQYY